MTTGRSTFQRTRPLFLSTAIRYEAGIVLIDGQDHFVVNENRRGAKAVEHVEWSKRQLPTLFARRVKRDQTKLLEEDVDIRAVGDRTRRSWTINVLQTALTRARHFALPKNLSRLSDREQITRSL